MITSPKIEWREAQAYAGIRTRLPIGKLGEIIPSYIGEVIGWFSGRGVEPVGPPLIRYHVCPTNPLPEAMLDICVGWPIPSKVNGDGRIVSDSLPAGKYASIVYTGVENGIAGNAALIEWARANGIRWDSWEVPDGEGFGGRVEFMLDGPEDDPDPSKWRTEVAIRIAGD